LFLEGVHCERSLTDVSRDQAEIEANSFGEAEINNGDLEMEAIDGPVTAEINPAFTI